MPSNVTRRPHSSRLALIIVFALVAIIVASIVIIVARSSETMAPGSTQVTSTGSTPSSDTSSTLGGENAAATISFTDNGFVPTTLTVKTGTKVTVRNNSSQSVQFSSDDHPTHRLDPEINLAILAPGETGTFTATTIGSHGFHDHIDDSKTGRLVVTE